jgi:hypothetical protein
VLDESVLAGCPARCSTTRVTMPDTLRQATRNKTVTTLSMA